MSETNEDVKLSLKVMINKEKNKVLFAEADSHFVDILLSFLTLPLGRIIKILDKHYGDEAPAIGSLSSLYHSLANLDTSHFVTEGAKQTLLDPRSSFEYDYGWLKLDITECQPAEYFSCRGCYFRFRSVSMYYDLAGRCKKCRRHFMEKEVAEKVSQAAYKDGVFIINRASSFIVSDDLQIFPSVTGLYQIVNGLSITDTDATEAEVEAEAMNVTIGLNEMLSLLRDSFISQTPLSNLILNKPSVVLDSEPKTSVSQIEIQENPNSENIVLKVMVQKSSSKVLYAQAEEDFVEFLFSLLHIPLGGVHHLLSGKTRIKAIDNLYRSTGELIHGKYFMSPDTKNELMKPNVVHGCISEDYIIPLFEEPLPDEYSDFEMIPSSMFPEGRGRYLDGPTTYMVTDDLTVTPFCVHSIFSSLNEQKIPMSDVKEIEVQVGLIEGLNILKASLTSTSALTDALLNKQAKSDDMLNKEAKCDKLNKQQREDYEFCSYICNSLNLLLIIGFVLCLLLSFVF